MNQSTSFAQVATNLLNVLHGSRKNLRLLLVMFLTLTVSANAWGAEDVSTFTSSSFEGLSLSWSRTSSGTLGYEDARGVQHQKNATTTFTATGFSNVTKVQVWVAKSKSGAGSVKIQENTTAVKTISSFNTSSTEQSYTWSTPYTGTLKIVVNATNSSIYIKKIVVTTSAATTYTVTYDLNGGTGTPPTQANVAAGGTFTLAASSGFSKVGYSFAGWNDGTKTYNAGDTYTMPANAVTLKAQWTALPKYTVTLNAGPGSCEESVTETSAGAGVELPTPTLDCGDWEFAGWKTTSAVTTETTTEPTLIPAGAYSPTSDITLYAVYQRTETTQGGGSGNYELVTSAPSDWSGTYLIVDGSSNNCFNGSLTTLDAKGNYESVTISDNTITANTTTDSYSVTISKSTTDGTYYIKTASGYYIGSTASTSSDGNELKSSTSTKYDNSISISSNNVTIKGPDHILKFFHQTNADWRFRYFKSTTTQNVRLPQLYKKSSGSSTTTYYHSTPDCGSTEPSYSVTIDHNIENGTVTANPTSATAGTEIALTATPNKDYQFSSWTVTKEGGGTVEVTNNIFTMPASNVTVSATFVAIPQLATPTNLQVTNISCNEVTLSWDAVTNVSSYTVVYKDSKYTNTKTQIYANTTTIPVAPGTTYDWTVQAIGNGTTYANSQIANGNSFTTSYKITYDVNGGSWTACADGCVAGGEDFTICSTVPTKTGYDFMGWSTANDETAEFQASTTITNVSETITLYAVWKLKTYTITWVANGQEFHKQENATHGTDLAVPSAPDPETYACDDKVFVGWTATPIDGSTDTEPADLFKSKTDKVENAATTYYAVFATASESTTIFKRMQTLDDLNSASKIAIINAFSSSTYILNTSLTNEVTPPNESNGKITVTEGQYWTLEKSNSYWKFKNSDNKYLTTNTIPTSSSKSGSVQLATSGNNEWVITNNTFTNNGTPVFTIYNATSTTAGLEYNNGWILYYSTDFNTSWFTLKLYIPDVAYSAYTTLCDATKATITYDLNGGTGATCAKTTVTKDVEFTLCDQTPTKDGYTFAGWSDGTKTYTAGSSATVNKSTTFYATWTPNTITITWYQNYNDCPESETSTYIYDGEEIEMPDDPTRVGYKFIGWYTAPTSGEVRIDNVGGTNKPTANVTYYARWAQLFTVTFMASGQNYVVQEYKYLSGDNLELPVENPSAANYACDGYIFEGWTNVVKPDEDATPRSLVSSSTTITENCTFYALWKKASTEGAGETIFYESFDDNDAGGGNDGNFNTASNEEECYVDNDGWEGKKFYEANQCIKLGGGSAKGYITTPALSQLSGNATLSFKAAAWNGSSESTTLVLSISGGGTLDKTSVTLTKGAWQSYEVTITGGTSSTRITFEGQKASDSRFFLDEVKVTTSGSYLYTTSPSCGPTIVAKDGMWVTSANSQSVKVNVPIAIKSFTTNATITGTTANSNFAVTTLENTGNGEHNLVVTYTPNASDIKEDAAITLTAKDGEETISTTTFTLNGRSLPDQFAIVVDNASEYFALPANMPSEGTYAGFGVTLNAGSVTSAPKTHLYTAQAVHSTRFAENGTALRLVGNNNACLWATNAVSGTDICNYAQLDNAKTADYEWHLYTEDGDAYRISCTAVTEEGRILRMYGANFGMYKSGAEVFYLLPVECTSTPTNIQVSPARVSATISWENAATCDLQVLKEGTPVQTISGAVSPVVVIDLEELTAYTFTLTPTDAASCKVDGAFTTTGPDIDIVEWMTDGMIIQVDKDDAVNPSVVINGEVEYNTGSGAVATELFFSKYFEAHGENKLLAIYNGTGAPINLSGYKIKSENGALDLSQFGQTKGQVAPNEEIILVYYDEFNSAEECAELQEGYENWNILTEKSVLAFSGRGSIGLYKDDVLIDVIGSTFPSGELTKIGRSDDGCGTGEDVRLHIDEESVNDQSSFFCYYGDNIKTDEEENDYAISTNRCLLIRKNTVTSGANAVASNKAAVGATCGDLSLSFTTLCSEWSGFRIGSGKSSSDEIKEATCDGLGYVGGFDYSKYYREYQQIGEPTTLDEFEINKDENLYKITIDPLSNYSCLNVSVELRDPETDELLTQQVAQVPIIVASENTTTDELFSNIIADDLDASKTRCSTCDVVILKDATLTKAAVDTENDVNQVRDIYIYPGGKLVVPADGDDYSVNSLSLRRVEDKVSMASVQTPLLITSSAANPIYVDVRVNSENWHWFTLPYNCNIADVTWADGTPAKYNVDWFLMWYDGESRAASTNPHDNHWKVYEGTTLEAGKGYIVGITGHPTKSKVKYELRFPMAQGVLTAEKEDKTVAVNAWGITKEIGPNNKGWNLVGNPYMDYYQPNTNGFAGLPLIKYLSTNSAGEWLYEESGGVPFLVIPQDGGWSEYKQELTSDVDMQPFTAYFVQVGNPENNEDGEALNANFEADKRGRSSLLRRAQSEVDDLEEPAIVAVSLTNAKGESDKTTLLIADRFTNEYEMNADFFKWFGDYYTYYTKPVLYTLGADNESRAFNALNEELAAQPVALGMYAAQAGEYTFSLYQRSELSRVEEVWLHDATSNTHTNLMLDNYTFSTSKTDGAGRFSLSVKMKPKIATDIDDIRPGQVWATSQDNEVIVNGLNSGLQLWLYDAVGKLLYAEPTTNYQHRYTVPQDGVYFITVKDVAQVRTIKVVVE